MRLLFDILGKAEETSVGYLDRLAEVKCKRGVIAQLLSPFHQRDVLRERDTVVAVLQFITAMYRLISEWRVGIRFSLLPQWAAPAECRAWTIRTGMTAQEAVGVIHSDFVTKFIRAA